MSSTHLQSEPTVLSPFQLRLLEELAKPFPMEFIKWRVVAPSRDKKKVRLAPYADTRAYTDVLNRLLTPAGWSETYTPAISSPIQREKKGKLVTTAKLAVACTLTIHALGTHSSTGEEWCDDDNGMTRGESQAFKRAAARFGLGRYLYDAAEVWVPVNEHGDPAEYPKAIRFKTNSQPQPPQPPRGGKPAPQAPNNTRPANVANTQRPQASQPTSTAVNARPQQAGARVTATQSKPAPQQKPAEASPQMPPLAPHVRARISGYVAVLGPALQSDIVRNVSARVTAGSIQGDMGNSILMYLENAARKLDAVRADAEAVPQDVFFQQLDALQIDSLDAVPSYNALLALTKNMDAARKSHAA